jgi:hypothetical protein
VSHINEASDERVVKNTAFIENAKAGFRVIAFALPGMTNMNVVRLSSSLSLTL